MTWHEDFWEIVCGYQRQMLILVYFLLVMLLLTLFTLVIGEPGTNSYFIAIFNAIFTTAICLFIGAFILTCRRREI